MYWECFKAAALAWTVAEVVYLVAHWWQVKGYSPPAKHPDLGRRTRRKIFDRMMRLDATRLLEGWFFGAPLSALRRDNVLEFLAFAVISEPWEDLGAEYRAECVEYFDILEKASSISFPAGYNPDVRCIRHTLDPLDWWPQPLALVLGTKVLRTALSFSLRLLGFQRRSIDGLRYWVSAPDRLTTAGPTATRSASLPGAAPELDLRGLEAAHAEGAEGSGDDCAPVLFMHGLGLREGLYLSLLGPLKRWANARHRTLIVPEFAHLSIGSLRTPRYPAVPEVVQALDAIVAEEAPHAERFAVVAHSFGTLYTASLLNYVPDRISSVTLLDPVSCLLCLHDVTFNFLYRLPALDSVGALLRYALLRKFSSIQVLLRRAFWWQEFTLWLPDDIPAHVRGRFVILLAGKDDIAPTRDVLDHIFEGDAPVSEAIAPTCTARPAGLPDDVAWVAPEECKGGRVRGRDVRASASAAAPVPGGGLCLWFADLLHGGVVDKPVVQQALFAALDHTGA